MSRGGLLPVSRGQGGGCLLAKGKTMTAPCEELHGAVLGCPRPARQGGADVPGGPTRRAVCASVLCGKYSSTLRRVRFETPQGVCPFSAEKRQEMGAKLHRMATSWEMKCAGKCGTGSGTAPRLSVPDAGRSGQIKKTRHRKTLPVEVVPMPCRMTSGSEKLIRPRFCAFLRYGLSCR